MNTNVLKKLLINSSVFIVSLAISIILVEFLLRIIFPMYDPRGMLDCKYYPEDDVTLCLKNFTGRLWKNTGDFDVAVKINRYGFRDAKDLLSSTDKDIFVLGDSMGLGWGVEEDKRFSDLLQAIVDIPVYNISAPAGDLNSYKKLLSYAQKKGVRIRNLILAICMENDLRDYDCLTKNSRKAGTVTVLKQHYFKKDFFRSGFHKVIFWLERNSATYQACASLVHQNYFLCWVAVKLGWIRTNEAGMHHNLYSEVMIASALRAALDLARPFNTVFVIIPARGLWMGNNRAAERKVHERFTGLLRESGADIVDLRNDFEKTAQPLTHYFKNDGHLNEKGHLAIALALLKFYQNHKNYLSLY